ncbi:hypothetical protein DFH07DRAFT_509018 [Mycena maculata]|uniref:Uncharacterized protein n=1 Tax=Mycena maculata TaxID=230809 RepID=A0AAD7NXP6_9AGAR|nr:hypothetical protein DFH07DRAFT_509018 [Mycena maculata]
MTSAPTAPTGIISTTPTLLSVPSITNPSTALQATVLAPIPTAAQEKLDLVLNSALTAAASFGSIDDELDPGLEHFFDGDRGNHGDHAPQPPPPLVLGNIGGKGKEKAVLPPPPARDETVPPRDASTSGHEFFRHLGFAPGSESLPKHFTAEDHKTTRTRTNTLTSELFKLDEHIVFLQMDLTEVADTLNTKVHHLEAASRNAPGDRGIPRNDSTVTELICASNQHGATSAITQEALNELAIRMAAFEEHTPSTSNITRITTLEAGLDALTQVSQQILVRVSALSGTSLPVPAPAPAAAPAPSPEDIDLIMALDAGVLKDMLRQMINANGKRTRNNNNNPRNIRQNTGTVVAMPASVQFTPAAVQLPAAFVVPPTTPLIVLPTAPPAPSPFLPTGPPALPPSAPPPSSTVPPSAPLATHFPRAPAAPESPQAPLAHQVLFGPINFGPEQRLAKGIMGRIIAHVLPHSNRPAFCLRRAHDKNHTHVIFDSEAMATWIMDSWAHLDGNRGEYEIVTPAPCAQMYRGSSPPFLVFISCSLVVDAVAISTYIYFAFIYSSRPKWIVADPIPHYFVQPS